MKLKIIRTLAIACVLIVSLFSGGAVFADEEELTNPGITPDSPFYFLDKMGKGLGMFFAFMNEAKVKKALQYGEERLAEAETMVSKNRMREMERAANDYEGYMETVRERLENGGVSDNLTERVCLAASNHLAVLDRVRQRVRGRAGDAIANAENASLNGQISALRTLSRNRFQRAMELTADSAEQYAERLRMELPDNMSSADSSNGTGNTDLLLRYLNKIEELEEELIAKAEEYGYDVKPLLDRLARSTANRLISLSEAWDNASENGQKGIENAFYNAVKKYENVTDSLKIRIRNAVSANDTGEAITARIRPEIMERLRTRNVWSANETDEESTSTNVTAQDRNRIRVETQDREQVRAGFEGSEQGQAQQQNQGNNGKNGK